MDANKDILYNIMLNSNIKTIENLCKINKVTGIICKSKAFWKDKLMVDGYLFDNNIQYSMKSYKKINNIMIKINRLIRTVKEYNDGDIIFYFKKENLNNILPSNLLYSLQYEDFNEQIIEFYFDYPIYNIEYILYVGDDVYENQIASNIKEIKNTLFKIFYYYPKVIYT